MKTHITRPTGWWLLLSNVGVAILYYLGARPVFELAVEGVIGSPVWPPAGIAFAAMLLLGHRIWPGVAVGAFAGNYALQVTAANGDATMLAAAGAAGVASGAALEALAGTALLHAWIGIGYPFDRAQHVFKFVAVALAMCLVSATLGPLSVCAIGLQPWSLYETISLTWWIGDVVAVLILTPLILTWVRAPLERYSTAKLGEAVLLLVLLIVVGRVLFAGWLDIGSIYALPYLIIPLLLWAAYRFGAREAATAVTIVSAEAIWGAVQSQGPFLQSTLNESLLLLQAFIGVIAILTMALAAAVAERRRSKMALEFVLAGTATAVGDAFFPALCKHLSRALDVGYVLVTAMTSDHAGHVKTLAYWHDHHAADNIEYELEGTPCEKTFADGEYQCPAGVRQRFPKDAYLADINAESYLGVAMPGRDDEVVGHICVLDDRPIADPDHAMTVLRLFAARGATELERLRTDELQRLMMAELDHRVKNNLAMTIALAEQTAETSSSLEEFETVFAGRIQSMAVAHELLARTKWEGAELSAIVRRIVEAHRHDRVTVEGPQILLPPNAAPAVCMVLHELVTNASKYGALSVPHGRVSITWRLEPDEREPTTQRLHVRWIERDGPAVSPPAGRGFGSELIEQMIVYQLHGESTTRYEPAGLECELLIPLARTPRPSARDVPGTPDAHAKTAR